MSELSREKSTRWVLSSYQLMNINILSIIVKRLQSNQLYYYIISCRSKIYTVFDVKFRIINFQNTEIF